jgi:uncharacterized membrane protein YfcA
MDPKTLLLAALLVVTVAFVAFWVSQVRRQRPVGGANPGLVHTAIGFGTNFLDTLGIGSFATTTTLYRLRRMVADEEIPGTLNVGHSLPTVVQALIYITIVRVDITTLIVLIVASVAGSWIGATVVARLPRRAIQRGMGVALLAAAVLMMMTALSLFPLGGEALGLDAGKLMLAAAINFVLGALMTLGIGAYAPIMIMISLLGMNPTAAFPIMMGSCAFLMPTASVQFIRKRRYDLRAAVGLAAGGVIGVPIAAYIVRSLPLGYVRWLVVIVVVYAGWSLLRAASQRPAGAEAAALPSVR